MISFSNCTFEKADLGGYSWSDYQFKAPTILPTAIFSRFENTIYDLSSTVGPRLSGTDGEKKAKKIILNSFGSFGYTYEKGTLMEQPFYDGVNIIARKLTSRQEAKYIILLTAYYDTVAESPGAKANASGVAALLEIARIFSSLSNFTNVEVRFVATAAGEKNHRGTNYYINNLTLNEKARLLAVYNFDVFASNKTDTDVALVISTLGKREGRGYTKGTEKKPSDNIISKSIKGAATLRSFPYEMWTPRHYGESAHVLFDNAQIEAGTISIRGNKEKKGQLPAEYHTKNDIFSDFHVEMILHSLEVVATAIISICQQKETISM
ncbi:MAG: M28 family peptidase [Treponemataceae bacterium]